MLVLKRFFINGKTYIHVYIHSCIHTTYIHTYVRMYERTYHTSHIHIHDTRTYNGCVHTVIHTCLHAYTLNVLLSTSALVNVAEDRLLSSVIHNSYQLFSLHPILTRRPGLRKRAHPFTLPLKDDKHCIPHVQFRALLPPVQP